MTIEMLTCAAIPAAVVIVVGLWWWSACVAAGRADEWRAEEVERVLSRDRSGGDGA